ncbi:hypothetical protein FRB96_009173 [Tulasnella sp. 330]|nr:hypothetical protein FRB96_009173 [Tulasnella sp. 330]
MKQETRSTLVTLLPRYLYSPAFRKEPPASKNAPTRVERAYIPVVSNPSNEVIASYVEAGIWGVVLCLIVASLPRAYMRWRHPSIRSHGLKLKASKPGTNTPSTSISGSSTPPAPNVIPEFASRPFESGRTSSMESVEKVADDVKVCAEEAPATPVEGTVTTETYSRVASWGSIFYSISQYLDRPVWWAGYSVGLSLAFATYTGIISFGILYHNLPAFGPRRAGWIVAGQMPFIIFLSTKNNILGFVLGMGYEKACLSCFN